MQIVPFDPWTLVLIAVLNPAVIIVAFMLGRRADQWQKLIVAAFAAALSGFILYWLVVAVGLMPVHALGGEAAMLTMGFFLGLFWSAVGYWTSRRHA